MVLYNELKRGAEKITPNTLKDPELEVITCDPIYYAGTKMMCFFGKVKRENIPPRKGTTSHSRPVYNVSVAFTKVMPTTGLENAPEDVKKRNLPRPSLSKNPILVRCNCDNTRFRANYANKHKHALYGGPIYMYPGAQWHWNNDIPMTCKHVMSFIKYLQNYYFITE